MQTAVLMLREKRQAMLRAEEGREGKKQRKRGGMDYAFQGNPMHCLQLRQESCSPKET